MFPEFPQNTSVTHKQAALFQEHNTQNNMIRPALTELRAKDVKRRRIAHADPPLHHVRNVQRIWRQQRWDRVGRKVAQETHTTAHPKPLPEPVPLGYLTPDNQNIDGECLDAIMDMIKNPDAAQIEADESLVLDILDIPL